jgi:hypothetical protein
MRPRAFVVAIAIAVIAVVTVFGASPSAAHDHVIVGEFELIVGWTTEPAIVGSLNGLDLGIERHLLNGSTEWVSGVAGNLTATLRTGSASVVKALSPQFGQPGWYTFDVIPTREGAYSVRLVGTLNVTAVDVIVELEPVGPRADVEWPIPDPTPSELQDQITTLSGENAVLRTQVGTALAVGIGGALLGVVGIVVGFLAGRRARRGS